MRVRQLPALTFILVLFSVHASAQIIKIDPESPSWGSQINVTANPSQKVSKAQGRFYPNDLLYAMLGTAHQGVWRSSHVRMHWDGLRFSARMTVPEGSEWGNVSLSTNEKYLNIRVIFIPRMQDGTPPPGALIAAMNYGGHDRKNWKADIDSDLARNPEMGWAYKHIWGMRRIAMGNLSVEELLKDVERVAKEKKESPGLLQSLAYGYFLGGQSKKAFEVLETLCQRYPNSPYATIALDDANYQVFSHSWEDLKPEVSRLIAYVANNAPENPGFHQAGVNNYVSYLRKSPGIALESLRRLCHSWIAAAPDSPGPYLVLADALSKNAAARVEAQALVSKAIELSYQPGPGNPLVESHRSQAYHLRAQLREKDGDVIGALTDAKMAQAIAPKGDTADLDLEAELWGRLGRPDRVESTAIEAYRRGSLAAEKILKTLYRARTGSEDGFQEYFIAKLTGEKEPDRNLELAPEFEATTLDGNRISLKGLKGKAVVLNFWFINCGPCRGEMPELNKIVEEFKDRVRFLAFASDSTPALKGFLKENSFKYEIIPGDGAKFSGSYKVEGFPTHFLIDQNGRIAWEARGAHPDNIKRLRAMIQRTLDGR